MLIYIQRNYGLEKVGYLDHKVTKTINEAVKRKTCELYRAQSNQNVPKIEGEDYTEGIVHSPDVSDDKDDEYKPKPSATPHWHTKAT